MNATAEVQNEPNFPGIDIIIRDVRELAENKMAGRGGEVRVAPWAILAILIETSRLRAENERLKAALREIDKIAVGKSFGMGTRMQAAARAALTEGETK